MPFTRRSVLVGTTALAALGDSLWTLGPDHTDEQTRNSVGVAIGVNDAQEFRGLSGTVTLERVRDPWQPGNSDGDQGNGNGGGNGNGNGNGDGNGGGNGSGNGNGGGNGNGNGGGNGNGDGNQGPPGNDVLHVTSALRRGTSEPMKTFDIGLSLLDVSDRELTVGDIAGYGGDGPGFAYDWGATESDVVGVDTDHEGVGSPDDVWMFLDTDPENERSSSNGPWPQFRDSQAVFRTMYADRNDATGGFAENWDVGQWNTRDVTAEFESSDWKKLNLEERRFDRIDEEDGVTIYEDALVVGVGISRGDPYYGPSTLDSYYRDLTLAGTTYEFPATLERGRGRPR
ncbi:hypothetical protein [Halorubellus sp. PRR65]|uniref:hypothetical protein n=1 Tax=Halorubellus sp. PRR65 TaxID=3098148 RepID=UPI002B263311|nr:hypothetical protein [Halorubellus sp. PRR65]